MLCARLSPGAPSLVLGRARPACSRGVCAPRLAVLSGEAVSRQACAFFTGAAPLLRLQSPTRQPAARDRAVAVPVRAAAMALVVAAAAVGGLLLGLLVAKATQNFFRTQFDPERATLENVRLRAKIDELQQLVQKYEPMAYKTMSLQFTRGVNKAVILGLVDELLQNKEVNIWWLPDSIERIFYYNLMTLMLKVLDEIVEGMSVNFAGHNVKLRLTYLDMQQEAAVAVAAAAAGINPETGAPQQQSGLQQQAPAPA